MKKTVYVYEYVEHGELIEMFKESKDTKLKFLGTRELEYTESAPEKKREPIEAYANVYKDNGVSFNLTKKIADSFEVQDRLECVRLVECPEGSAVVGFAEFRKAWNTAFSNYTKDTFIMDADGSAGFKDLAELLGIKKAGE